MKRFLYSRLWISSMMGISVWTLPTWATPLISVSQLTIPASQQSALQAALPQDTENVTTWIWQGNPFALTLPLHQEYRLIFAEPVQVNVNGQLNTNQLRVINDHQTVYFTALQSFKQTTRLYITLKNSGQIIFLDISTTAQNKSAAAKVIHIELAANLKSMNHPTAEQPSSSLWADAVNAPSHIPEGLSASDSPFFSASADDLVQASRFVWRQLYAPSYRLSNESGFMRTPLHTTFWVSGLLYSETVWVHPLASWMREGLFVSAVELRNPASHLMSLDLAHDLCGQWRAAMLYPRTQLQPAGHKPADSTTLFLMSSEPFDRVLSAQGCDHGRT